MSVHKNMQTSPREPRHSPDGNEPLRNVVNIADARDLEPVHVRVSDGHEQIALLAATAVKHAIRACLGPIHPPAAVHRLAPALPGAQATSMPKAKAEAAAGCLENLPARVP